MRKLLNLTPLLVVLIGMFLIAAGIVAALFTYQSVAREKIVTPEDAAIPNAPVRDPLTLKAQADVIRKHVLEATDGKTYSEMPQQVAKVDATGSAVLDEEGKPVMVPNTARNIWVTATTLTTALNLGLLSYMLSGFVVLIGFVLILLGLSIRGLANIKD